MPTPLKQKGKKMRREKAWGIYFKGISTEESGLCSWGYDASANKLEVFETKLQAGIRIGLMAKSLQVGMKSFKVVPVTITYHV